MTNIPYKLPNGWQWVKLGEVCKKPQYGISLSASLTPVGPKFLRVSDITSGRIDWETVPYCRVEQSKLDKYKLAEGDLLFARSGSVGATILIKENPPYDTVFASYLIRVKLNETLVYPEYLYLFTQSPFGQVQLVPRGATHKNINAKHVQSLLIPLPPLEEQKRIVARIEELRTRIKEAKKLRQESKEKTELLWQSALAETFPKPGTQLPDGWQWVKLGEIFEVQQGVSMSPRRRLGRNPIPFLRTSNILWGSIDLSSIDEMDFTDEEVKKLCLQPGDLLVCEGGEVGRTAIWEGQLPLVLYQNHIHRLRRFSDQIEPRFFMYWMQAAYQVFQHYQGAESRTAIPNLSGSRLKQFIVPLPPLQEQKRIVAHLQALQEKIKSLKESQTHTETKLKELENSILDKAFKGEL
jgi:type I restriction enzyme S subunit